MIKKTHKHEWIERNNMIIQADEIQCVQTFEDGTGTVFFKNGGTCELSNGDGTISQILCREHVTKWSGGSHVTGI